ncbi:MAG: hypothetical protein AAFZ18_07870 [Myxococcota bacterium]
MLRGRVTYLAWLLAGLMGATVARAEPGPSVARARVQLETARLEVDRLLAAQRALASSVPSKPGQARPADTLLANEAALEAADARRRDAERTLREALAVRMETLGAQMRILAPKLRAGPLADRKGAATRLLSLRDELRRLRAEHAALAPRGGVRWGEAEVGVDPLDGPEELREKADFLADAGDKLRSKRTQLLASLDARARRSRLDRAANRFAQGNRLFDEETRPGRVLATGGGDEALATNAPEMDSQRDGPPAAAPGQGAGDGFAGGEDASGGSADPTSPVDFSNSVESGDVGRLVTQPPPVAGEPEASAPTEPVPSVTPARSLGDLLELEPAAWQETGPDEVRALIQALEAAEQKLAAERRALLDRARALAEE